MLTCAQLGGSVCTGYMCISPYVLLVWCSRALYTWGQLEGGPPHVSIGFTGLV